MKNNPSKPSIKKRSSDQRPVRRPVRRKPQPAERDESLKPTSWDESAVWYNAQHGQKGGYYHEKVIIPGILKILKLDTALSPRLLDIGCGQGVLARHLPATCSYMGIDLSKELILLAKSYRYPCSADFKLCDARTYRDQGDLFTHFISILSLQNMEHPAAVVQNLRPALVNGGKWVVVINHPCFRIPRFSSWGIDERRHIQYRRIDRYLSFQAISMQTHPSLKERSPLTWNFHYCLSEILAWFFQAGFTLIGLEEWCSDKKSTGRCARQEDKARKEFPLFMALLFELPL